MRNEKRKVQMQSAKLPLKAVAIVALVLLAVSSAVISVDAHMPGAKPLPEFELEPISIYDGDTLIDISLDDIGDYHGEICVCGGCAFRATQLGISKILGDEIPARDDIKIVSRLPTPGSRDCFQYITGTGPGIETKTKGEYKVILPDGTAVVNLSNKDLKKASNDNTLDNFRFEVCRKSTGECFEVVLKLGVFSEDYFELRKKVKFGIPENATSEEKALFKSEWEDTRDKFLTSPDWELFEDVEEPEEEEPDVVGGATFLLILVIGLILLVALVHSRKKAS
ncbi:hypothetical protein C4E24_06865 [ANME-1 cluster archaeon AG-394-G21]|nr:hypothetical protein [ANME-1 cluster archaeon AG-394-G21]